MTDQQAPQGQDPKPKRQRRQAAPKTPATPETASQAAVGGSQPAQEAKAAPQKDTRQVSDGYHTFQELYDHRNLLFISLALALKAAGATVRWKPHYPGWPVMFVETGAGQISYHFEEKYLPLVTPHVPMDDGYQWDGHTSAQVLERLANLTRVLTGTVERPKPRPSK